MQCYRGIRKWNNYSKTLSSKYPPIMQFLSFSVVNKLAISCLVTITLSGCGHSREERASSVNCKNLASSNWYSNGRAMGSIASIASDGKRDCNWGKKQAIESESDLFGYPADEENYGDCWCKGFLDGYDNK